MKKYLGVKLIEAEPSTHGEYSLEKYGKPTDSDFSIQNKNSEGYKVKYDNDYVSWSPKKVFEEAYREINNLTFGLAIEALKKGKKVTREGWNGKGMWIELQIPDEHSKMTRPYIYHVAPKGTTNHYGEDMKAFERVPWLPSNTDILAEDWSIVE